MYSCDKAVLTLDRVLETRDQFDNFVRLGTTDTRHAQLVFYVKDFPLESCVLLHQVRHETLNDFDKNETVWWMNHRADAEQHGPVSLELSESDGRVGRDRLHRLSQVLVKLLPLTDCSVVGLPHHDTNQVVDRRVGEAMILPIAGKQPFEIKRILERTVEAFHGLRRAEYGFVKD